MSKLCTLCAGYFSASAIRLKKTAAIDFDSTPEVRLRVKCSDGKDYDREYFKLFLRRNVPPSVTNMFSEYCLYKCNHTFTFLHKWVV